MSEKDEGLIRFLMREKHAVPYEHSVFTFRVKLPLFVLNQWAKHRISSISAWSGRYSELEEEFYIPDVSNIRTQVGKPGAYTFEVAPPNAAEHFRVKLIKRSEQAYKDYQDALAHGIAKEQARLFLLPNLYTVIVFTVNARSLINFLSLRNSPHAQQEIREYAIVLEEFFKEKMPITYEAFVQNGRKAI